MAYDPPWKPGRDAAVGAAVFGSRAVRTAGRWALLPARTVAGAPIVKPALGRARQGLAANGRAVQASGRRRVDDLALTEVELAIDRVLAGPVTEAIGRSLADHEVPQRIAAEFLARTDVQALLAEVLESQATADITDRVLASPQFQHAIEDVASSPAVRDAVAAQTRSLVDDVVDEIRGAAERLDDSVQAKIRAWLRRGTASPGTAAAPTKYGGLSARAVALVLDVGLADLAAITVAGGLWLVASVVGGLRPEWLVAVLVAVGWAFVVDAYLVVFWTMSGQTPGMRLLHLRVVGPDGDPPGLGRSLVRLVGLIIAIAVLFVGLLPVLVDRRRRGLHDWLASTTVESTDQA